MGVRRLNAPETFVSHFNYREGSVLFFIECQMILWWSVLAMATGA